MKQLIKKLKEFYNTDKLDKLPKSSQERLKQWRLVTVTSSCDCNLYESTIHPIIKFIHDSKIDPTGWVEITHLEKSEYKTKFLNHMSNDLDTPQSIAVMFDLAREINRAKESGLEVENAQYELKTMGSILGITFSAPETKTLSDVAPFVDLLLEIREDLREANQYNLADKIRNSLQDLNINIEDTSTGPKWQ